MGAAIESIGCGSERECKRLLYLSVCDPHVPLTGAGVRGAQFVNALARRFDVDLVYLEGSGQAADPDLIRKYVGTITGCRSKKAIPFEALDYFIFSRQLYAAASGLVRNNSYDFILCDYGLSGIYGILLSKRFKIPLIYCSHNIEYRQYLGKARRDPRRYLLAPYVYGVEKAAVQKAAILVPISPLDANHYERWASREKMLIIPQGFDERIFNPFYEPPKNTPQVVLFCGNFRIQTNRDAVELLLQQVIPEVLTRRSDTIFRFIGINPLERWKRPGTEFLGFVEDYPSHLKQADLVISAIQQGWGFPTKIIEALACGKTTIATPAGARAIEGDYVGFRVCQIEEFPDAICDALDTGRTVITENFDTLKARYSWSINLARLCERIERWTDTRRS
jgi:glycosyltransferase involved in cell wall biosynthesis